MVMTWLLFKGDCFLSINLTQFSSSRNSSNECYEKVHCDIKLTPIGFTLQKKPISMIFGIIL